MELMPDGTTKPWPRLEVQWLFVAPFGLTADTQGRVWFIEPAALDRATPMSHAEIPYPVILACDIGV